MDGAEDRVGSSDGSNEGLKEVDGSNEGLKEGSSDGSNVGTLDLDGSSDGSNEGLKEGSSDGSSLGFPLVPEDGDRVGVTVGFFGPQPFPTQPLPAHASPPQPLTTQEEGPFPDDQELSQEVGFSVGVGPQPPPQDQFHWFPSQLHLPFQALAGCLVGLLQSLQALSARFFFLNGELHTDCMSRSSAEA